MPLPMDLHEVLRRASQEPGELFEDPPGTPLAAEPGRTIYFAGDPSDQVYVLLQGRVCCALGEDMPRPVLFLQAPALFGDGAVLAQTVARETVTALDSTRFIALAAEEFLAAYGKQPELTLLLARDLAQRHSQSLATLDLQLLALPDRLLALLTTMYPSGKGLELHPAALAQLAGATPKSVSKALAKLRNEALLRGSSEDGFRIDLEKAAHRALPDLPHLFHSMELDKPLPRNQSC